MKRLIQADNLLKYFDEKGYKTTAVNRVSMYLDRGEILGIVGESGSGKSTLLRLLAGLLSPDEGEIRLFGNIFKPKDRTIFKRMQMVFQDARASFDKQYTIGESLDEIRCHLNPGALENGFLLQEVGLDRDFAYRYPMEMSGGECQRAAIARALAADPEVLLCDEITSALDVITQQKIYQLLIHLCKQHHIAMIFVSHNLPLVANLCDRIMIMHKGKAVESGNTHDILGNAKHAYTKELLDHIFTIDI